MQQNSYPYQKTSKLVGILIGFLVIFFIFLLWYIFAEEFCIAVWDVAIKETVNNIRLGSIFMMLMTLIGIIITAVFLIGGYNIHTILVSDQGIELQRKKGSILITKIEDIIEKNPNVLKVEGITTIGNRVTRMFGVGDMGKEYWPKFKNDLRILQQQQSQF